MDIEAQIIGVLNGEPMTRIQLKSEFAEADQGNYGLALMNLLEEGMITTNNKKKLILTEKAKKQYNL
jgi:hypothetical protein